MDQSVWFVETQQTDDWRWFRLGESCETRSLARTKRDFFKSTMPGIPFRVKQYKRVDE